MRGYVVQLRHAPVGLQAPRYETFSVMALDLVEAMGVVQAALQLSDEATMQVVRILSSEEANALAFEPGRVKSFP